MTQALRSPVPLFAVGLFLALMVACGGDGSDNDDGNKDAAPATLSANAIAFSAGPFSGSIEPDWLAVYLDIRNAETGRLPGSTPDSIKNVVGRFFAEPKVVNAFYVFLEKQPDFSASVNILACEPEGAIEIVSSPDNMLSFYKENGIKAEKAGKATYNGAEYDILRVDFYSDYDTHIAVLKTDDCYTTATMISKKDDTAKVQSFKALLSKLVIDPAGFQR